MKLQVSKRAVAKKSEVKAIRREGNIPAVVYIRGKEGETISVNGTEFNALLRQVQSGRLSTTIFELDEKGAHKRRAVLKEITYDPVSYQVIHLDFEELNDKNPISIKVPIELVGLVDCVGVKLGGVLRQVIRSLRVRCLPKDIPAFFQVDIRNMGINEVKRLSDLGIPETVRPLIDVNEVAVVIGKR
jgi:large subunit ribosomal protein L25